MNEPSVLDYVKSKLMPWKYSQEEHQIFQTILEEQDIASFDEQLILNHEELGEKTEQKPFSLLNHLGFLRLVVALGLGIIGQSFLDDPVHRQELIAIVCYLLSAGLIIWTILSGDWGLVFKEGNKEHFDSFDFDNPRLALVLAGIFLLTLSFFAFLGNKFTPLNLVLWAIVFLCFWFVFYDQDQFLHPFRRIKQIITDRKIVVAIKPWYILLAAVFLLAFFFRFYRLDAILPEMVSDHAEKLLDVWDIFNGESRIFFPRNTGREFFQFYLTAFVAVIFNTGISFLSLKIGTALAGFFTLPYIYALGKELGNKWIGLFAMFFAGISYWGNVISRVGLRFPLYPLFVAPTLFYLIRGLRQKRRNDFIYAGLALGLGLHGYSSTRFLPFVVVIAFILFILHKRSSKNFQNTVLVFLVVVLVSLVVFMPLLSYMSEHLSDVTGRSLSRLGNQERAYPGSPVVIFFDNLKNAVLMPFYDDGNTWVHSIPFRPALDIVSAVLYLWGTIYIFIRYIKYKKWEDIFLLLAVPLLMMPSILSLAFPEENPSLNRTGGAIIPIFILVGYGMYGFISTGWKTARGEFGKGLIVLLSVGIMFISGVVNYDLVFNQYEEQFLNSSWNTSEIGAVIHNWANSVGNAEHAYVMPYPHWVDTRLVAINAGYPTKDYALWEADYERAFSEEGSKLFIIRPDDETSINLLITTFPNGQLYLYDSEREGKDFYIFEVPDIQ